MSKNWIEQFIKLESSKSDEIDVEYFYRNMYEGYLEIEELYKDGYNHKKVFDNLTSKVSNEEAIAKYEKLTALQVCLLSLLIGINREAVQYANSKVKDRKLFKYSDYKCMAGTTDEYGRDSDVHTVSKRLCRELNFNPTKEGPFPYMLEILTTDSKIRPYDYVSKIRNAFEHGEYCLKKGELDIINVKNHDDNNVLTFEGNLLIFPYRVFVEDYYGYGLGVSNDYRVYDRINCNRIANKRDLKAYLRNVKCEIITFKEIPEKYQFSGEDGLFAKLNSGTHEGNNFEMVLDELTKEGVVFEKKTYGLNEEQVKGIVNYLRNLYGKDLYKTEDLEGKVRGLCEMTFSYDKVLSNCFNNLLRYIDLKKETLASGFLGHKWLFDELKDDERTELGFKCALMLIKASICNYALENKNIVVDYGELDTSKIYPNPVDYYLTKVANESANGESNPLIKVKLNTIRNAMAHGDGRISCFIDEKPIIKFSDVHKGNSLDMVGTLDDFDKVYSADCFKPENIMIKDEKGLIKIK